jgi:hypothetical protein
MKDPSKAKNQAKNIIRRDPKNKLERKLRSVREELEV